MRSNILCFVFLIFVQADAYSQGMHEDKTVFIFESSYVGDMLSNYSGGIERGSTYMGMIDFAATLDLEGIGLWPGGEFLVHLENTHGGTPSGELIGDLQVASNIDNGNYTYLYELLYRQALGDLDIIIGKQDLNADFFVSDFAGEYINSSFGIMPTASLNAPVAIFPKTALAAAVMYDFSERVTFQAAIYDGNPLDLDSDPYSTDFRLSNEDGFMTFGELHIKSNIQGMPGGYKIGIFNHSSEFDNIDDPNMSYKGNTGVYFIADQLVYKESADNKQGLGLFLKAGYASGSKNMTDIFMGFGANYYGLFSNREDDVLGVALARASIGNQMVDSSPDNILPHETVIELIYAASIHPHVTVKPDIQYIMNTGADASLSNAIISIVRFEIMF